LEALLAQDPDTGRAEVLLQLQRQEATIGAAAVAEVAAATTDRSRDILRALQEEARLKAVPAQIPEGMDLRRQLAESASSGPYQPWLRGEATAKVTRAAWNIPDGPIDDATLCKIFS
jgi:hypothetical protein